MYQLMARYVQRRDWTFMNFGHAPLEAGVEPLQLDTDDEPNRYCIQLSLHVTSPIDIEGLKVLEVGCGRGGGSHFLKRRLRPVEMVGLDYSAHTVALCRRTHVLQGLRFIHGDAEDLPFDDASFDVVINIESSHCYGSMERFLEEVARVLRPGGHFLFADFRPSEDLATLERQLAGTGLEPGPQQDITPNILAALSSDNARKLAQIRASAPRWLSGLMEEFAGAPGSLIHDRFKSGSAVYISCALRKAPG